MKKKFDWKLTACLVSLFISFLLLIFFYDIKSVLCISLLLIAVSLFFFALIRAKKIDLILAKTEEEIEEEMEKFDPDEEIVSEVYNEMSKLKKQKRSTMISFSVTSVLLVVLAILSLF